MSNNKEPTALRWVLCFIIKQNLLIGFSCITTRGGAIYVNTTYTYRADGTKLRKEYNYKVGANFTLSKKTTDYLDGFQYETENNVLALKFFPTAEGYYDFEKNKYIYSYADHLGNVRLSYTRNGSGAEIIEENNFYPFGLKHEGYNAQTGNPAYNYQYNGKELQKETGWSDFGARMYMSDIGRWGVIDPFAEQMRRYSPYNYAYNNPISFTDPDGRKPKSWDDEQANIMYKVAPEGSLWWVYASGSHVGAGMQGGGDGIGDFFGQMKVRSGGGGGSTTFGETQWYRDIMSQFKNGDPRPKYTKQHFLLIQGLSTVANKLFGTPFTLDKLTESEKQAIFKQSARKTTAILMYEYASGTGPAHRNFYPEDAITEDIKWSNSSARATTMFADDYNSGRIKDGETVQYYIGSSPDKIGISGSISAHLKGLADQSIWRGGMIYNMQKRGDKLYVNVFDKYTVSSGISRNDSDSFNRGKSITPLGTTTINIHFNYQWINTQ